MNEPLPDDGSLPSELAEAQKTARSEGGPLPPFYWAAFVLSGDWR